MFEARRLALKQRQLELRLRQAELRTELAADAARLRPALTIGDLGIGVWHRWRSWTQAPAGRWSAMGLGLLAGLGARSAQRRWRRWLPWLRLGRAAYGLWRAWDGGSPARENGAGRDAVNAAATEAASAAPETPAASPSMATGTPPGP
ncbi:hypothetical protein H5407_17190 [Mitsuaria sp. WAJ17]|uniref:hypothetical protein n=1 Tax=Mitsuaria sp. WAJ17 TaxID=2761452 RepID=UPI0016034B53|nr:hypothetical protein [Mitsuaria sp. WAJ17]MBB2486967.1 hypothetical protein [Mitsuaria sp. WAJ17]